MSLNLDAFTLGPLDNNAYVLWDDQSLKCVVIDPTYEIYPVARFIKNKLLSLEALWITHAHFDHILGIPILINQLGITPQIYLHPADMDLWKSDGGASSFNMKFRLAMTPTHLLSHLETITLGEHRIEVRHTPGHTAGHVVFYSSELNSVFSGDLLFHHSIGRTDLPGGHLETLLESIRTQILSLPPDLRILPGHGQATTVEEEINHNPYL